MGKHKKAMKKTTPISTTTAAPTPISSAPQPPITGSEPKSDEGVTEEEDRILHMSYPEVIKTAEQEDYHPDDETDNVPDSQPSVPEEDDVPEPAKFAKLVAESKMLTEFKLQGQLARLINSGCLPNKQLWQTDQRHQVAKMALAKCKDVEVLNRQWPMIRWLRGRTLGNARNEMMIVMSWVLLGVITELMVDDIACES